MRVRKICFLLLFLTIFTRIEAAPAINVLGYLRGFIWNDPSYYNPGGTLNPDNEWCWDTWQGGHELYVNTPVAFLGGARGLITIISGTPRDSFYVNVPVAFSLNANKTPERVHLLSTISNYIFMAKGSLFTVSLSTRNLSRNDFWVYESLQDPLGALKLPNTSSPRLTFKIAAQEENWDLVGYLLADERCNFLPCTETIPKPADDILSAQIGSGKKMNYYDEMPIYRLMRTTRKLGDRWTLGLLWGQKQAENINPREEYEKRQYPPTVVNNIGYLKENIGLDLQGRLPFAGKSAFTFATVSSSGQWRKYDKVDGPLGPVAVWDSLGEATGNAIKIELDEFQLGKLNFSASLHSVDPDFQWVAVRDSRYAMANTFCSPSDPYVYYTGWRAILDEDFHYRDPRQSEDYLSDVSSYLGLRAVRYSLGLASQIRLAKRTMVPAKFRLTHLNMMNLREDGLSYFEPISWQYQRKNYKELDAALQFGEDSKFSITGQRRDFQENKQDYRDLVKFGYATSLENLDLTCEFSQFQRKQLDSGNLRKGSLGMGKLVLEGMNNGIKNVSMLDYRSGTYDLDLNKEKPDYVLAEPYTYVKFSQYVEFSQIMRFGSTPLRLRFAGEANRQKTNFAGMKSGTSLVGYVQGQARVTPNLALNLTGLAVTGPRGEDAADFASSVMNSLIDCEFSLRPFGSKENTIIIQLTQRFREEIKTNINARWQLRLGRHTLTLEYGRAPYSYNTTRALGTPMDISFYPDKEVIGKPWAYWSEGSLYSLDTTEDSHNYITLNWFTWF